MINFNLKKTAIWQAVKWNWLYGFCGFFKKIFFVLFIVTFFLFLYGFILENFSAEISKILLGSTIIFLFLSILSWYEENFFNLKLKRPKLKEKIEKAISEPDKYNLAEFLSYEAAQSIWKATKFCKKKKISQMPPEAVLYFVLDKSIKIDFIFSRALFDLEQIRKELKNYLDNLKKEKFEEILSLDSQKVILEAAKITQKKGKEQIEIEDIILSQSKINPIFQKKLVENKLKPEDIENLIDWFESLEKRIEQRKKWWSMPNLMRKGTLAKEWTAGYTITLDRYSTDLTEIIKKQGLAEIIGHKEGIKSVERILSRTEINNVLLVGEPGTGRKSIIEGVAQKSFLGESLPEVNYKRVVELNLLALITEIESTEEIELVLDKIFQEVVSAGNVILIIDGFHNFVVTARAPGIINISGILSSYLKLPQFQIICISSYKGLHKYIEQNPSLLFLFEKVEVSETLPKETLLLLESWALILEQKYKIFVSYPALKTIFSFSDRYFPAFPFPKKALDILDEVMVYVSSLPKEKTVLPSHVAKIVSKKTEMPVGELKLKEREILLNLEDLIHKRIINQTEAVKGVSTALRRARVGVTVRKKPMGTFLFLGPTGVGKTETSKALAEIYFGSEKRMIRLDMSEFQDVADIPRLIGSITEQGLLTTQVRENSFSLILLDEIEKAHPNILNLFLQVLDEGHLTDGQGRKVNFKNSIIIATSNAGYKIILKALEIKSDWSKVKEKLLDFLFEKGIFRPEFINRFDAIVVFQPLTKENLLDISELMFQKLKKNLKKEKGIEFIITQPLKEKIVELGYDPKFGAREMKRVIQDKVENILASALLKEELKRGARVEVDSKKFKLIINP